ncbi:MAG: dihydrodipicolinate synthase family protein [Planctomycetota bacterium]|nr:dihydrodipicolinate synthase family protein [Planctomycetota bacterium]
MPQPQNPEEIRALLDGPVNSIPTTFNKDGSLDEKGIRNIVEVGIQGGSRVALLTYGDSQFDTLSEAEFLQVTRWMVEQARGRALTVAAGLRTWTEKSLEHARAIRDMGADVLMVLPSTHMHDSPSLPDYYRAIARVMPVMLVGAPPFSLLDSLRDVPGICSFKEDGSESYAIAAMRRYEQEPWKFMTGGCLWRHYTQWPMGCRAFMSAYSCFKPQVSQRYWDAIRAADMPTISDILQTTHLPFFGLDATTPGGLQAVWRGALEIHGVAQRFLRAPKRSLTDGELDRLRGQLTPLGLR